MSEILIKNDLFNQLVISASGTIGWTQIPEVDARWADEVSYQVTVEAVSGSPTSWSLIPQFHQIMPIANGQEDWLLQYGQAPVDGVLNAMDHGVLLPDGDWPIFSSLQVTNTNLPLLFPVARRIRGGFIHRLSLVATLVGGAAPTITVSVNGPNLRG